MQSTPTPKQDRQPPFLVFKTSRTDPEGKDKTEREGEEKRGGGMSTAHVFETDQTERNTPKTDGVGWLVSRSVNVSRFLI